MVDARSTLGTVHILPPTEDRLGELADKVTAQARTRLDDVFIHHVAAGALSLRIFRKD
ncbi:hypothetical protein ACSNOB_03130 [Micromonospora sp. URMC 106]|uniref:hypothetical protein n=1 Tax=Micromonospora sp. URMC 106 TaxID=3423408 RepID=UPI003F1E363F